MLPKHETVYHKVRIGKEEFEISAWKTIDEKNYLIRREQGDVSEDSLYDVLIKPRIKDADSKNLTDKQKQYIMVKIREISLGSDISINFKCTHCGAYQDIDLDLNEIVKYKPESYHDVKIDDMTFKIAKNTSKGAQEKIKAFETAVEKDYATLLYSINAIVIGKETHDTFTFEELQEYINGLDTKIFNKLFSEFYEMVDEIKFNYKVPCQVCKEENSGNLSHIPNFLWA